MTPSHSRRIGGGLLAATAVAGFPLAIAAGATEQVHTTVQVHAAERVAHAAGGGTRVGVRRTSLGTLLVNGRGFTVYAFTRDGRDRDRCITTAGCAAVWPALRTSGRPVAGAGVRSRLFGTIRIAGGARQVTYAGRPLYTYSADTGPGQTAYVGASSFGGTWRAVTVSGSTIG